LQIVNNYDQPNQYNLQYKGNKYQEL